MTPNHTISQRLPSVEKQRLLSVEKQVDVIKKISLDFSWMAQMLRLIRSQFGDRKKPSTTALSW